MSSSLKITFKNCENEGRKALINFIVSGYPTIDDTIPILKGMQRGGVDIIELGIPFSDPIADGPTIQEANTEALSKNINISKSLKLVKDARSEGVTVPIVLMCYYNPILQFGEEKMIQESAKAGVNGFIIVDLPPEECIMFRKLCKEYKLSYIPLVAPSTTDDRLAKLCKIADSFIYVVSRMGTTGASQAISYGVSELCSRVRKFSGNTPLAVGFGVSTREHFLSISKYADGVIIGSQIINLLADSKMDERENIVYKYVKYILGEDDKYDNVQELNKFDDFPMFEIKNENDEEKNDEMEFEPFEQDEKTIKPYLNFGSFGGQFVPEAMRTCLDELEKAFESAKSDPEFWDEFTSLYSYIGRPSSFHKAERLTKYANGAQIWLKREDLNHTGSHKINNAIAQCILARRLGKSKIIAETGAGQHGVATATACAKFGMKCIIFMGAKDVKRQALNVFRMRILGAKVISVKNGSQILRDATSEAFRYWVSNLESTYYVVGSAIGPYPYPILVRTFQSCIGIEAKNQFKKLNNNKLPDAVVACVGGGSNASGIFSPFELDKNVQLLGVEAAGDGLDTGRHSATLTAGVPGVFHGVKTYVLQDEDGQIRDTHSISAGLDYPGVGPELAYWKSTNRASFVTATDAQALLGFRWLSQLEGIIPALESSHAIYAGVEFARTLLKDKHIIINVSGRGDKDVQTVAEMLPKLGDSIGWDLRFQDDPSI